MRPLFMRGRKLFLEEARVLAKLRHPNIVEVLNFFQANATVYLVMTYDHGRTLSECVQNQIGKMPALFLMTVFVPLLSSLKQIHGQGLLHLDIKPQNILIRPSGPPLLLDFGAVQPYPYAGRAKGSTVLTHGFSPEEQYSREGQLGPWSDIYAIGATMRMCLDGNAPPPAPERLNKDTLVTASEAFRREYPAPLLKAIDIAMGIQPEQRPRSVDELLAILNP
jgi:serine/threonine protein kinase